jgi:3-oxoacyl-[acyl-carrier-protein] synthase II
MTGTIPQKRERQRAVCALHRVSAARDRLVGADSPSRRPAPDGKLAAAGRLAAGLALDDAGFKEDAEACASMDMIVSAGGGERDIAVDSLIVEESRKRNDREQLLNEKLTTELRPTLFLAQLSNLLAGNISIVHKVTGSSRTLMGERRRHFGNRDRPCAHCRRTIDPLPRRRRVRRRTARHADGDGSRPGPLQEPAAPFWNSDGDANGMNLGTAGAFLVLESLERAEARGAHIYARLDAVLGDRGSREGERMEQRLARLADETGASDGSDTGGVFRRKRLPDLSARERAFLKSRFPSAPVRTVGALFGHSIEAHFTNRLWRWLAWRSMTTPRSADSRLARMRRHPQPPNRLIVTTIGHFRGEGIARLTKMS